MSKELINKLETLFSNTNEDIQYSLTLTYREICKTSFDISSSAVEGLSKFLVNHKEVGCRKKAAIFFTEVCEK